MNDETRAACSWRDSKLLIVLEFAIVAIIFFADVRGHIFISKTLYLFVLAWISLHVRRLGWKQVGLARPRSWTWVIGAGILAGVGIELLELFVTQPLLVRLTGKMPDLSLFLQIHGNFKLLLLRPGAYLDAGRLRRRDGLSRVSDEPLCRRRQSFASHVDR